MSDWISCAVTRPCESSIAVSIIDSVNDFTPYPNSRRFRISVANNRSSRSPSSTYGSISSAKFACVIEKIPSLCHRVSSPSNATSSITPQRLGGTGAHGHDRNVMRVRTRRREGPRLLAIRHDLREQHRLEHLALWRLHHEREHDAGVDAEAVPHLLLQEPVAHAHRRFQRTLLTFPKLGARQLFVVILQREHPEGHVTGFIRHPVPQELLQQRFGRE